MGIGGTGVVTVNQILGTAALLDGKHVAGLDQTGLSQKGGPVVSHLRIADTEADIAGKVGVAEADAYLGFDLLVATAAPNLLRARPDLTIAVVSTTQVPTGAMVASTDVAFPDPGGLVAVDQPRDPEGRERVRRRPRAGGGALRRPHGRQHDPAGRGVPGGGDPGAGGRDRARRSRSTASRSR